MERPATPVRRRYRIGTWRRQHAWCVRDSVRQLARRPAGTLLTIAVMGLALTLPLAFYLVLGNVQRLATALGTAQSVNVFLKTGTGEGRAAELARTLRARDDVGSVAIRTPQQGLAELATLQGFGDALQALPDNPLPFVLVVEPRPGTARAGVAAMVDAVRASPDVALVQDSGRWRARLDALMGIGQRVALVLAVLLGLAALLVIGNTVRLDLRSRSEEITVQRLVGASAAFVRRPYLYEGAWYGLAAGIVAVLLVLALEGFLDGPARDLVASYAGRVHFRGLSWDTLAVALAIAVALGWSGAWLASSRYLAHPRA